MQFQRSDSPPARQEAWRGSSPSQEYLAHLGLTWDRLERFQRDRGGRPVADLCAGGSPFALEATSHGINTVVVDSKMGPDHCYRKALEHAINASGSGNASQPNMLDTHFSRLSKRRITADCAQLPFEDRAFSVVTCHHGLPKHFPANDPIEKFFTWHLREMLRVTDYQLRIFPFVQYVESYETEEPNLVVFRNLAIDPNETWRSRKPTEQDLLIQRLMRETLQQAGAVVRFERPTRYIDVEDAENLPPRPLAIFTRLGPREDIRNNLADNLGKLCKTVAELPASPRTGKQNQRYSLICVSAKTHGWGFAEVS